MNNNLPMICYWCGTPLSKGTCKREHVPPRGFFPKGYREGLLTVPACDEHNTKLSQLDETFQFLIKAIGSNEIAVDHFKEKGVRMLQREESKKFAESLKRSSFYAEIERVQRLVFSVDVEYTDKFVEKVVRGLFFLHNKKPVQGTVVNFSHEFFNPAIEYRELENMLFSDNDIINSLKWSPFSGEVIKVVY